MPAPSAVSYTGTKSNDATVSKSWAEQATELSTAGIRLSVRLRGKIRPTRLKLFQDD